MLDEFRWLASEEEVAFEKIKFKGKLAGLAYKYSLCIDGLIRTRIIIFAMSLLVFYPMITNYLFHEVFILELFFERLIFSAMLLMAGILFNRFRIVSLILACIPLLLIAITYLAIPENFNFKRIGFILAILILIASGFYYHFKAIRLKKELAATIINSEDN